MADATRNPVLAALQSFHPACEGYPACDPSSADPEDWCQHCLVVKLVADDVARTVELEQARAEVARLTPITAGDILKRLV